MYIYMMYRHPGSYLRDYWNVFDFIILIFSWIPFLITVTVTDMNTVKSLLKSSSFTVIRAFKIFKLMYNFEQTRTLFLVLLKSFPPLVYIGIILNIFLFLMSCIAVQNFSGILNQHCEPYEHLINNTTITTTTTTTTTTGSLMNITAIAHLRQMSCMMDTNDIIPFTPAYTCDKTISYCKVTPPPVTYADQYYYFYFGFDTIFQAYVSLFISISR